MGFDGSLRADYAVVETINYGDNPLSKLVYPESKRHLQDEDDGGTSKEVLEELVDSNKGILNENEAAAVGPCGGGTCASVRTVRTKLQERISNVETNGQSSKTNIPDTRKNSMCDPQKVLTHNPFLSSGSNVLGGEKVISSGAHYYVEEPDSPRGSHTILQMGCGSEDGLNKGRGAPLFSGPEREGGSHKMGEEGLVSAFSKVLNLKRKTTCSPERDSKEKRQKRLLLKNSDQIQEEDDEAREGFLQNKQSLARARASRGRGGRGERARGAMVRGGNLFLQYSDRDLVDVNIREGEGTVQAGSSDRWEETNGNEEDKRMKALVAGLKQPHDQW